MNDVVNILIEGLFGPSWQTHQFVKEIVQKLLEKVIPVSEYSFVSLLFEQVDKLVLGTQFMSLPFVEKLTYVVYDFLINRFVDSLTFFFLEKQLLNPAFTELLQDILSWGSANLIVDEDINRYVLCFVFFSFLGK